MSALYSVGGSRLSIGGAVAAKSLITLADFASAAWTEIKGWTSSGAVGDTQQVLEQGVISDSRVRKIKGVRNAGTMENTFLPMAADPGQIALKAAELDCRPYAFRVEWGAGCLTALTVAISSASPAVVTATSHGFVAGQAVMFTTTGVLPTGLSANTLYYVRSAGLTANEFTVSATPGGAAVNATAAGSGVHSVTSAVVGQTSLFYALVLPGARSGGDANAVQTRAWSLAIDSNVLEI